MTTIDQTVQWSTILAPGIEEIAPANISFERWGLLFIDQPIDTEALRLALLQYVVELYVDDRMQFTVLARRAPPWGVGFPLVDEAPPAKDPRKLKAPLVCARGARLLFRFVQCAGEPVKCTPRLVLEGK